MADVDLKQLIGKLNTTCSRSLESAVGLCLSRTNYNVEIAHWLLKILESDNTDVTYILRQFDIDASRLTSDLTSALDDFKRGNSKPPALGPDIVDLVKEAWLIASIEQGAAATRSGHLICALVSDKSLSREADRLSDEFAKISAETLRKNLHIIVAKSDEEGEAASTPSTGGAAPTKGAPGAPAGPTKTPSLDQFTIDLTERAKNGEIDPVLGRDPEIRQIVDILMRRRQNNPILTGEAGVGKTAVVEGFAIRIAEGDVPDPLKHVSIRTLDLGLLQAGAGVKGEFENRLKSVIQEVKSSPSSIILFIDEAHTMIGAGGQAGQGDAANLLKPALARGELRTIAATTWAEYKKYFERDAALARRFQVVKVDEPEEKVAVEMMRGLVDTLEQHHEVRILNDAVVDSVRLSDRYISGRQLPDKSVSVLDTTCARIAIGQAATPPPIEDCQRSIDQTKLLIEILEREAATGASHGDDIAELRQQLEDLNTSFTSLNDRWEQEKQLVDQIRAAREQLEIGAGDADAEDGDQEPAAAEPLSGEQQDALRQELKSAETQLREIQGDAPLVHPCVDSQAVAETVAAWTGIPLGRMVADEVHTVLNLKTLMEEHIVGQSHALEQIAQSIQTSRAGLSDPRTPIGVFLLAGTSGVGKTETAITLANLLYGGEQNMTTINMSEFKEEHKVSLLMGSPPGYVGYGEGGILTEAVRRKPYSVVLLDELEKAHQGVQDIFYQVFDKGQMKDGEGRDIDFKNTVILMTTNAGTDLIMNVCGDPETMPDAEGLREALFPELLNADFKPAFLGRLKVIPFFPLSEEVMKKIIVLKLNKIVRRFAERYKAELSYTPELIDQIASRCTEVDTGARNVDHILTGTLLPDLSAECLSRMTAGQPVSDITVSTSENGDFTYEFK